MLHILFAASAGTLITIGVTYNVSRGILRILNKKAASTSAAKRS